MAILAPILTADEFLQLPDDGFRYELLRGELRKKPYRGWEEGALAMRVACRLAEYVHNHELGHVVAAGTGFLLSVAPDTVLAPCAAFISKEREQAVGFVTGYWPGSPDLAVEVISSDDTAAEVEEKVMDWLRAGTQIVIVANPRSRTVAVYRSLQQIRVLTEDDTLILDEVVPGWAAPVRDLFG